MFNHAPVDYVCPFCRLVAGGEDEHRTQHDVVRRDELATTYGCDGTSLRQHNEPAGNQDRWHYHLHVFPRYAGDDLYFTRPEQNFAPAEQRLPYANKLRAHFEPTAGR